MMDFGTDNPSYENISNLIILSRWIYNAEPIDNNVK